MFSCECYKIFKKIFFIEDLRVTVFDWSVVNEYYCAGDKSFKFHVAVKFFRFIYMFC